MNLHFPSFAQCLACWCNETFLGERPYRCRMCSRTFSDSSTLTKHCRIHSGEKPYQCDFCPLNFSQSGNLSRHLKLHLMNGSGSTSSTTSSTSNASSSNQSTTSSTHHVYDSFCNTPIDNIKEKQDKTIIDVSSNKFNQIVEAPELKQMITKHDAIRFSWNKSILFSLPPLNFHQDCIVKYSGDTSRWSEQSGREPKWMFFFICISSSILSSTGEKPSCRVSLKLSNLLVCHFV